MSKEIDFDRMTDDDVADILNQIDTGTFDNTSGTDDVEENTSIQDEQEEDNSLDNAEENGNLEDTENQDEEDDSSETNIHDDGLGNDTENETSDSNTENSQVDKTEIDGKVDTDTDSTEDAKTTETGKIDPAEYEKLKSFYEKIANAEFVANGKKVKGFTDPDKIIRSQQMAYGFSDKMRGFNEYRPFLKALKDKGLIEDETKFNFAMSLIDGDKAAIKQHLKTLNVDPVDLELDETEYSNKNYVATKESLILEDTLVLARETGIEDKLRETIGKQWDEASFKEFIDVKDSRVREDLISHMQSGAFDNIQDKIKEMEALDANGSFSNMKSSDKYRRAVEEYNKDFDKLHGSQTTIQSKVPDVSTNRVDQLLKQQEAFKIKSDKESAYQANVQKKNMQADEARRKATELSKKKTVVTKTKKFDPLSLEGDDLSSFVDGLISGNIK